jgi:hypothetical protein
MKEETTKPKKKKLTVRDLLYLSFITIAYKVFYFEDGSKRGWFVRKRPIVMILIAPLIIPFFMLYGAFIYLNFAYSWDYHWIDEENKKLSFKERLGIKYRLLN